MNDKKSSEKDSSEKISLDIQNADKSFADLFAPFKQRVNAFKSRGIDFDFLFQILKNERGEAIVRTMDKETLIPLNCGLCRATDIHTRRALQLYSKANNATSSTFNPMWAVDSVSTDVVINNNPALLVALLKCDNLINAKKKRISISESIASLTLEISEPEKNKLESRIIINAGDRRFEDVVFLSDSYVLCDDTIFATNVIGDNYTQLPIFKSKFPASYLQPFLSIFYSFIDNAEVNYLNYSVRHSDNAVTPTPVLFFEKVDEDQALYMHVMSRAANLPPNFTDDFNISRVAAVDHESHRIEVRPLAINPIYDHISRISHILNSAAPTKEERKEIYNDGGFFIVPQKTAGNFLLQHLTPLLSEFTLAGLENIRQYKIYPVKPRVKVNLSSGIDFLEGDVDISIGNETFTLKDILAQYKRDKSIKLKDGTKGIIDANYIRRLERIFRPVKGSDKVKVSFFDLPEVETLLEQRMEGEAFQHQREVYEGFNHINDNELTLPKVNATLRDYQIQGVKWMKYLNDINIGGCLADDMGLGKTLQTITLLMMVAPTTKLPSLIVMPKSLIFNWKSEIEKFAPKLKFSVYYGTSRDLAEALKAKVVLTSYATVRNDIKDLMKRQFEYVILDESQYVKNVAAQTSQAVKLLKAKHRLALSGTPIENNLTELYSLYSFLNPAMFGTIDDFNARYTVPIQKEGDADATISLRKKIFPFMLRRLKEDVLTQLPEKIEQRCYVEMSPEQAKFYEERRRYYKDLINTSIATEGIEKSQLEIFKALTELRRIASVPESLSSDTISSPKIEMLMENLLQAVANGHKVVVFFNYIAGIELVGEALEKAGIEYATMTGATNNREKVVSAFQTDPNCKVLLMTIKTGGVGLNLTAADIVYIFEPWWNKAAENQAISRLHRIGQHNTVFSYSIITLGTIEEKIALLQDQKQQLFDALIGSDSSVAKHLSEEDINYILS